ncbi:MAG: RtcB family protein [Selenomonas sp.]|nr:RtcB family protein [Selenomonas sp.]
MERMEIRGRCGVAIAYVKVIEEAAVEQIRRMCDYEFTKGASVRIMPDVHFGKGCTIGTTMTVRDKVVPNLVGVDIGCGMYTVDLGREEIDLARFDEAAHFVPSGRNIWEGRQEKFDLLALRCYRALKDTKRIARSLGTLGGGNHFIEIDRSADGMNYLVIHTGSRNLGKQVAEYYQNIAIDLSHGKDELFRAKNELICRYKAEGRRSELQEALKELNRAFREKETEIPADLAFLYGSYLEDYLHDIEICQNFARRNREVIAHVLLERTSLTAGEAFHTIHNYIDTEERILRKGAIAAHAGERVLIPINMRDGSILAVGRGDPDWNWSAPHGAGRLMSRSAARENLSMDEFRATMAGVYTTAVNENTLDEAPMAYKALSDILGIIEDSVDVIEVLKPIYNFKAG